MVSSALGGLGCQVPLVVSLALKCQTSGVNHVTPGDTGGDCPLWCQVVSSALGGLGCQVPFVVSSGFKCPWRLGVSSAPCGVSCPSVSSKTSGVNHVTPGDTDGSNSNGLITTQVDSLVVSSSHWKGPNTLTVIKVPASRSRRLVLQHLGATSGTPQ